MLPRETFFLIQIRRGDKHAAKDRKQQLTLYLKSSVKNDIQIRLKQAEVRRQRRCGL